MSKILCTHWDGVRYLEHFRKKQDRVLGSPLLEFMAVAVRLAGLFHDLGKGTIGFNEKLRRAVAGKLAKGQGQDPVRHELISALLMDVSDPEAFMKTLSSQAGVQGAFEARRQWLASADCFKLVDGALAKTVMMAQNRDTTDFDLVYFIENFALNDRHAWAANPFWMTVMWLVMTHHKLPSGAWNEREQFFTTLASRHVAVQFEGGVAQIAHHEHLKKFLTMQEKDQPWCHRQWSRNVARTIRSLYQLREQHPAFEAQMFEARSEAQGIGFGASTPWLSTMARIGRMSLVMGDYEASCDDVKDVCKIDSTHKLIANTKQVNDKTELADFLHVHLEKVGDFAPRILRQLFINQDREFFKAIRINECEKPAALNVPSFIPEGAYAWQGHAQQCMSEYRHAEKGFFCVVAAGTGRGKTRACAAMMTASRLNPRFSVLLSMRSLTYQTAKAYLAENIGFRPDQVGMMVGDDLLRRRFRHDKQKASQRLEDTHHIGTDNRLNAGDEEEYSVLFDAPERATLNLHSLKNDHFLMNLLSAPVSVMTVDHVIRLVDLSRSKDALQLLHLSQTDLIFDEVDDYKADDLICIGRLIEIAGQFGRRVIVASATLPRTVVEGFRDAYLRGYAVYQSLYGAQAADSLIVTHLSPYHRRHELVEPFADFYQRTMSEFAEGEKQAAQQNPRRNVMDARALLASIDARQSRKLNLVPLPDGKTRGRDEAANNYYTGVLRVCAAGHAVNALKDPVSNLTYSAGFIRLNTVVTAQGFLRWASTSEELQTLKSQGTEVRFICYHAQNLGLARIIQEQFLETHLNRTCMNSGAADPLLSSEDVRWALQDAGSRGARAVIFIVVTSSIMETGRDFDFDWAVLEPCSTTSVIQAGGRVRRHRLAPTEQPNVFVMPTSLASLTDPKNTWRDMRGSDYAPQVAPDARHHPVLHYLGVSHHQALRVTPRATCEAFSPALINRQALHAGHCLTVPCTYEEAPLTVMERIKQLGWMKKDFARTEKGKPLPQLTLQYATDHCDTLLCNSFYDQGNFRGKQRGIRIEFLRDNHSWCRFNARGEVDTINHRILMDFGNKRCNRALFLLRALNFSHLQQVLSASEHMARYLGYKASDLSLAESELLGVQRANEFDQLVYDPQLGFYSE
jgi:CRISPR/Cas system-associated endonuclease/helicase Cas3